VAGRKRARLTERRKAMGLSQERLAEAVGVDTSTVARWERGETEPQAVHRPPLAEALKASVETLGELLTGTAARRTVPTYLAPYGLAELSGAGEPADDHAAPPYAWGALRTLEDLAVFLRSDMLTRRDILAASITMAAGKALTEPIASWLNTTPGGLPATEGHGLGKIGASAVEGIERTVRYLVASDYAVGGGLAREAAVGQLKYAVDLAQYASYSAAVGTRLLTVIADLADRVGWMSHDAGMEGPAQRYAWYGLQAAHEAGTEQAQLLAVRVLDHLAEYAREAGRLDTARRFNCQSGMLTPTTRAAASRPSDHATTPTLPTQPAAWRDTGTLPVRPDQPPPADHGMIKVTIAEARRLLAIAASATTTAVKFFHLRWSQWRRRHQARARWHHWRTRLRRYATT
jgi:transcriptional regulator with XRE-family HTH domain